MTEQKQNKLILPALRARMGDWIYYISFMKMKDIASRIEIAEKIHKSKPLQELIQRNVTNRSKDIVKYLKIQNQRFFNSLIIGVYNGTPQWSELGITSNENFKESDIPPNIENTLGFLTLQGEEKLFAIDGQHRAVAIKKAIKEDISLEEEEVAVIFVSAKVDSKNINRTRRLFSTLNRYAKPVNKSEIISIDEDDIVAIITRNLLDSFFKENKLISVKKGSNLLSGDKDHLTTVIALYDSMEIFLKKPKNWTAFKRFRPSDDEIKRYCKRANDFFKKLFNAFPELKELSNSNNIHDVISKYRHENGGHLIFRPVGLKVISNALKFSEKGEISKAVHLISKAPMELSDYPWTGLLWDNLEKKMITNKPNQEIASKLLYYMIGGNLSLINTSPRKLLKSYAAKLNKELNDVKLPSILS